MITICTTKPEHIPQLVIHQQECFPMLSPAEWYDQAKFEAHLRVFPEGQHVALDGERVVGQSSTFRARTEQVMVQHRFNDIMGHGYFTNHDPQGEWLYGADMSVHAQYRRLGIATALYDTRKALIRALGLRGMVAGGMVPGYAEYHTQMRVEDYVAQVVAGTLSDPTLTPQLRQGFTVRDILYHHFDGNGPLVHATLLVWEA